MVITERALDGRYRPEGLLGSGGMATVWAGTDTRLGRPVAIKELAGTGSNEPAALERFDREARTIACLSHPNIVSVHDFGIQDGRPYLIMELVDGPTVAQLVSDGPLPVADALAIAAQTSDGLAAAHAAGIIHRDVKPANLILASSGVVKICDFGIVQLLDTTGHASLTTSAVAMGSAMYMAPEQVNGERLDARADLYALGCTLYVMLAGRPPFAGTPVSVVFQHVTAVPDRLDTLRPGLPGGVADLVADLLAKNPDARPADAVTVGATIAALAADLPEPVGVPAPRRSAVPAMVGPAATSAAEAPPPASGTPEPAAGTGAGKRGAQPRAVAALVALAGVIALIVFLLRPDSAPARHQATPAPAPSRVSTATSASPGPVTPSTAPTAQATPAAATTAPASTARPAPRDPIAALRLDVRRQLEAGGLSSATATDLNHSIDDLGRSIAAGNTGDEQKKVKALSDKLANLYNGGKLTAAACRVLRADLGRLATALGVSTAGPPPPSPPPPPPTR